MTKYHWFTAFVAAACMYGCGSPSVKFESVVGGGATGDDAAGLVEAANHGAIVINIPVSRIMVSASAQAQVQNPAPKPDNPPSLAPPAAAASDSNPSPKAVGAKVAGNAAKPAAPAPAPNPAANAGTSQTQPKTNTGDAQTGVTISVQSASGSAYSVSVLPIESDTYYRATGINNFFSQNELGVTKVANTDIPTTVQNKFTDLTSQRITQVGQLITSTIGLAAAVSTVGGQPSCTSSKIPSFVADIPSSQPFNNPIPIDTGGCWSYSLVPVMQGGKIKHAVDTVTRAYFGTDLATGKDVGVWPVPSCMTVSLKIFKRDVVNPELSATVQIIDPENLRLAGIPDQGSISMHPVCDADWSNTPPDNFGTWSGAISALETQAQDIAKQAK